VTAAALGFVLLGGALLLATSSRFAHAFQALAILGGLLAFLGFSRRCVVVCLSARQRFRFLKFLALTLRGRVLFSPTAGERIPLSPLDLAGIWLRQTLDAREERALVNVADGSASHRPPATGQLTWRSPWRAFRGSPSP